MQTHAQSSDHHVGILPVIAEDDDHVLDCVPAKRGRSKSQPAVETRQSRSARLAADLPTDDAQLLAAARAALEAAHQAVVAGDEVAFDTEVARYDAAIYVLNGDSFFGSETDDGAATRLRHAFAADPGVVPLWGQRGEFLLEHGGVRAIIQINGGFGMWGYSSLHAASDTGLFVSETGYLSLTGSMPILGCSVEDAACLWLAAELKNRGRVPIDPRHRKGDYQALYPWLQPAGITGSTVYQEPSGQLAFGF